MTTALATRVLAGPPVLRTDRQATLYTTSGQYAEAQRERKGLAAFTTYAEGAIPIRYAEGARLLTNSELWLAYRQCPDVRSCVDAIVRKVSTWDWAVVPTLDPSDPRYERAAQVAADATRFFQAPNTDLETWQVVAGKLCRDLLVFDAMAGEHVLDARGHLQELVALRGGDITPQVDARQRLVQYRQDSPAGTVYFEPEQLLYLNLYPNTTSPGGVPLIETLISEIITLMRQAKHLMLAVDADEVPPGILVLAGIAGKAADRAVEGLRNMKGQDHRLRVLTSNNPGGLTATWVELRHTPKDLDLAGVVKEVRRTVWRLFGVKPISQGDTEATPRATAEVQVDAEDSGLILPILEAVETAISMRTLPLVVGDPELATMVAFRFDRNKKLAPEAEKAQGERDAADFDRGVITVNERRAMRGLPPFGPEGDVPLIKGGGGYVRLLDAVAEPKAQAEPEAGAPGAGGTAPQDGEGGGVVDPEAQEPNDTAPGEADGEGKKPEEKAAPRRPSARPVVGGTLRAAPAVRSLSRPVWSLRVVRHSEHEPCTCYEHRSGLLPSDWQPSGKFKGHRTLNLGRLGDQLVRYAREVAPLYRRARLDVVAAARSYLGDGKIDNQELIPLLKRVNDALDALAANWGEATEPIYRAAAQVGRDAAVHWTGAQVVGNWEARASTYHLRAMGYLDGERGLVSDLRTELRAVVVTAAARTRPGPQARATEEDDLLANLDGVDSAMLLGAMRKVFDSNEYRIQNWSGKLVELANEVFVSGMSEGGEVKATDADTDTDEGATSKPEAGSEWWYEWVSVGDSERCDTCVYEGNQGFRPVSQMSVQPGGATQCRGRCRCVLVWWSAAEVKNGTAVKLSNVVT